MPDAADDALVDAFAENYLFGFMLADVEKCILAKANYGVALMLMSYTEVLGGLRDGTLGEEGKVGPRFNAGLELLDPDSNHPYYSSFKARLSGPTDPIGIYELFRCGFSHQYFAAGLATVLNRPELPGCAPDDRGIEWRPREGRRVLVFHTNAYLRDFKEAVGRLRKVVRTDPECREKFNGAIKRVAGARIEEIP